MCQSTQRHSSSDMMSEMEVMHSLQPHHTVWMFQMYVVSSRFQIQKTSISIQAYLDNTSGDYVTGQQKKLYLLRLAVSDSKERKEGREQQ